MSDTTTPLKVSRVYVRQVTEQTTETDNAGNVTTIELPGTIEVGVDVEGVFVPLVRRKAAGLLADIARVKASAPPPPPPAE